MLKNLIESHCLVALGYFSFFVSGCCGAPEMPSRIPESDIKNIVTAERNGIPQNVLVKIDQRFGVDESPWDYIYIGASQNMLFLSSNPFQYIAIDYRFGEDSLIYFTIDESEYFGDIGYSPKDQRMSFEFFNITHNNRRVLYFCEIIPMAKKLGN